MINVSPCSTTTTEFLVIYAKPLSTLNVTELDDRFIIVATEDVLYESPLGPVELPIPIGSVKSVEPPLQEPLGPVNHVAPIKPDAISNVWLIRLASY